MRLGSAWPTPRGVQPVGARWLLDPEQDPRGRGTWKDRPALRSRAPENWYGRKASADPALPDAPKDQEVGACSRRKAWARLLAKAHQLDVMACPRCGSRMSLIAVIVEPAQIRKIIACLERHGRGPPLQG